MSSPKWVNGTLVWLAHSDPAQSDEKPRPMGIKGRQSRRRRSFGETPWGKFYHQIRPEQPRTFCRASRRTSARTVQTPTTSARPGALSLSTTPLEKPQALAHSASGFPNSLVMKPAPSDGQSQERRACVNGISCSLHGTKSSSWHRNRAGREDCH
jgi:hypothetical protein